MSEYEYDLVFENTPKENRIVKVLDTINDAISKYDVQIDACDLDNDGVYCLIDFNSQTGYDDCWVLQDTEEILKEMNVEYYLDNYPNIDECGMGFSYSIYIKFFGEI